MMMNNTGVRSVDTFGPSNFPAKTYHFDPPFDVEKPTEIPTAVRQAKNINENIPIPTTNTFDTAKTTETKQQHPSNFDSVPVTVSENEPQRDVLWQEPNTTNDNSNSNGNINNENFSTLDDVAVSKAKIAEQRKKATKESFDNIGKINRTGQ